MGKRFVPVRDADRRALELHFMIKEVEKMPLVQLDIDISSKTPILIQDKTDQHYWRHFTVDGFLTLSVEQAKAEGGTGKALIWSRRKPPRQRIPQSEVDRAADRFLAGEDDE
ncbi:hypothetical protein GA0061099_10058 [Bradyrhizobium yuanmingense]|uniref:Uncharacterized protein n=1 Tax=Bradyrhizobium yuanmingense TaxID=108015 RepID=A0A1C3W0E8_9BRAD|nr:hypothetical protein [Bradyrhizobium yuanmingense]TWI27776.1 hypothetical protein IQ15_03316 [Bradyrhizobium yuanmingense]SCB33304.1 hypothetical protein GA0061099_10058 [Bradyrhizobium yuanmingense]